MSPEKLTHLIYTSAATPGFNPADLKTILQVARIKNQQRSVTGILLHSAGTFFQVLEGEEAALSNLFAIISADPRHTHVTKIIHEPISKRVFGDWTMGYSDVTSSELEAIDGFSDFFQEGNSLAGLEPGRAKKLLSAFAQGSWRARLGGNAK